MFTKNNTATTILGSSLVVGVVVAIGVLLSQTSIWAQGNAPTTPPSAVFEELSTTPVPEEVLHIESVTLSNPSCSFLNGIVPLLCVDDGTGQCRPEGG